MQECFISAQDLACRRGDRLLFRGLALDLRPGGALQVAGRNGVGKSSLIRMIAGLLRPYAGRVEHRGRIGLLDERPALDPHRSLGRALEFWAKFDRPGHPTGEIVASRLGLSDLLDVPVGYLSTGQRKRAGFARLIGQAPTIWLLDEPLNGLDGEAAELAQGLAAEHCANGGICVIASHQTFTLPGMARLDLTEHLA